MRPGEVKCLLILVQGSFSNFVKSVVLLSLIFHNALSSALCPGYTIYKANYLLADLTVLARRIRPLYSQLMPIPILLFGSLFSDGELQTLELPLSTNTNTRFLEKI